MIRLAATIATASLILTGAPALAAGCIKGAAIGGVGGHYVGKGHAVVGAAAGCLYGHHRAAKAVAAQHAQARPQRR